MRANNGRIFLLVLAHNIFSFRAQHRRYQRHMKKKYSTHSPSSLEQRQYHQRQYLTPPTHTPCSETLFNVRDRGSRQDQSRFFRVHSFRRPQLGLGAVHLFMYGSRDHVAIRRSDIFFHYRGPCNF